MRVPALLGPLSALRVKEWYYGVAWPSALLCLLPHLLDYARDFEPGLSHWVVEGVRGGGLRVRPQGVRACGSLCEPPVGGWKCVCWLSQRPRHSAALLVVVWRQQQPQRQALGFRHEPLLLHTGRILALIFNAFHFPALFVLLVCLFKPKKQLGDFQCYRMENGSDDFINGETVCRFWWEIRNRNRIFCLLSP